MRASRLTLCALTGLGGCATTLQQSPEAVPVARHFVALSWDVDHGWPEPSCDVLGLRLGVIGARHRQVAGLDLPGLVGRRDGSGGGIAVAWFGNENNASFYGLQVAGAFNAGPYDDRAGHACWGMQIAPGNFGDAVGVQIGIVNGIAPSHDVPHSGIVGLQVGLLNGGGDVRGLQAGGLLSMAFEVAGIQCSPVAVANRVSGIQLGLLNAAFDGGGLQIGLLNYNGRSIVPWLPLLNLGW